MNKMLSKMLMVVILVLAIIGAILYGISTKGDETPMGSFVTYALILLVVAAILAIFFSLINIIRKPALLKKALLSIGVLGIILLIVYFTASDAPVYDASGKLLKNSEGGVSKWVGTGITYSLILLGVGLVLFLWDMIKNLIK